MWIVIISYLYSFWVIWHNSLPFLHYHCHLLMHIEIFLSNYLQLSMVGFDDPADIFRLSNYDKSSISNRIEHSRSKREAIQWRSDEKRQSRRRQGQRSNGRHFNRLIRFRGIVQYTLNTYNPYSVFIHSRV